jgi:hypothetical protein
MPSTYQYQRSGEIGKKGEVKGVDSCAVQTLLRDKLQQLLLKVEFTSTFGNDCSNLCQRCTV